MNRPVALLAVLITSLILGCPNAEKPASSPPAPKPTTPAKQVSWQPSKSGRGFRLSDADPRDDQPAARAKAAPLSDADATKVLARLPKPAPQPDDAVEFALRDR